ncbi:uncharacterized protein [Neodiprion pinetum]|uniref:uncharacterized protein n=1 Tax=Neodiprion pinetum TaxID=441929 RepID=UPI001EDCA6B9|nr:uncharacterized protein LOC124214340 [Neodiprion pinetum]
MIYQDALEDSGTGPGEDQEPSQGESTLNEMLGDQPPALTLNPVRLRVPPFCPERPALWFAQQEAQFRTQGIVTEIGRYYHTISNIPTRYAAEVENLIVTPPVTLPYQALKIALIARFSQSREAKILQLLDRESLGDRTPSAHLRHLRSLVPDIDEEILKARWLSHLPENIRICLVAQNKLTLTELSETADRVHEQVNKGNNVSAVSSLEAQIAALTRQVEQLSNQGRRNQNKTSKKKERSRSRSRSKSSTRGLSPTSNICWYHKKFGNSAKKCFPAGCKFPGNASGSR